MKKKFMLVFFMVAMLTCVMAISISAATVYKDASGNELFRYELESSIITGETGVGFAKADSDGNALTWYITATATDESNNTVYTVASIKTSEATTVSDGTLSLNTSVVTKSTVVSINFDVGNYTTIAQRLFYGSTSVLYAYIPNYVTTIEERLFRGASKLIKIDIPYDSELTEMGVFFVWGATNLREFFVPKNVLELNNDKSATADGTNNTSTESYFNNCKSLKKVVYHPDNIATEIKHAPFYGAKYVEEIRFSNNLKFLGDRTFRECNNLKTIYFGDSFEGFYSNYMFYRCTSLTDLYIPATVGTNTTGLTYRWYYVFKDATDGFKIHYTGTEEQFLEFYDMVIAAGGNEKFASAVTDGVINTDRVVFTTDCAAFYDESHDNQILIEYDNGYTSEGYKKDGCTRCGNFVEAKAPALFTCLGYSTRADGKGGLTAGYQIHKEALDEYLALNPNAILTIGLIIVNADTVVDGKILDSDGALTGKGVKIENISTKYSVVNISIDSFNMENAEKLNLAMALYVKDENGYQYMQAEKDSSYYETRSFGDIELEVVTLYNVAKKNGVETLTLSDGSITIS